MLRSLSSSRASWMGCIQGLSFSSSVPGRKPISLPMEMVGRATTRRRYSRSTIVRLRPAAMASSVLPVPALPMRVTSLTRSSSRASKAKCCSRLRGLMPQTPSRAVEDGHQLACPLASTLAKRGALGVRLRRAGCSTRSGCSRCRRQCQFAVGRGSAIICSAVTGSSNMPV